MPTAPPAGTGSLPSAVYGSDPAQTPPPVSALRPLGYFQNRWPAALILAAFPVLTLPMAAAVLADAGNWLLWAYVWLFGMTHFVVTFAVYLRSENLRHFASSWRNRWVFFLIPAAIFIGFDLYHALRIGAVFPVLGAIVLLAVRLVDFNHLNRQSFGVLQLFKARSGARPRTDLKKLENWYFGCLTALMFVTFLAGGVCPLIQPGGPLTLVEVRVDVFPSFLPVIAAQQLWVGFALVAAGLFARVAIGVWRDYRGSPAFAAAAGYLLVQTVAALMAAVYFPLYLAALAVHYIEYHVLMVPRCLRTPLDPNSKLDRAVAAVRARPVGMYLLVLVAAGVVTLGARAGMGMMGRDPASAFEPIHYLALVAVFDGLFIFHYFVEMFIWRFSDPHFRRELAGLYFAGR